jgi:hypothetical protein
MDAEGHLQPGQGLSLQLPRGAELFCAAGRLQLVASHPGLPCEAPQLLSTGQGWQAAQTTHVQLCALVPSRYCLAPAPEPKKKPREAGLEMVQRLLRGIMRGRLAA